MNNHQNRAGQSTREMAERQTRNRVWFAILTIGGILLILLVAYDLHSLGVGGIGAVGVWVAARVVVNRPHPSSPKCPRARNLGEGNIE